MTVGWRCCCCRCGNGDSCCRVGSWLLLVQVETVGCWLKVTIGKQVADNDGCAGAAVDSCLSTVDDCRTMTVGVGWQVIERLRNRRQMDSLLTVAGRSTVEEALPRRTAYDVGVGLLRWYCCWRWVLLTVAAGALPTDDYGGRWFGS